MSPILKKSLIASALLHVFVIFGSSLGIGVLFAWLLNLFGIDIQKHEDKIDVPVVNISVVEISDVTNIPVVGDNGTNADTPQEEPQPLEQQPEEVVAKPAENIAEDVVEENVGDETAPTEAVDDAGSNFTQNETADALSEEVMTIVEEVKDKPAPEEQPKEETKPTEQYKWDVPISEVVVQNRPAEFKNLANREEAAPQAQTTQTETTPPAEAQGEVGPNLDDLLNNEVANSTSGAATATLISVIKGQLGACYSPPVSYPTGRDYTILIRVVFSADGRIVNSQYAPGYVPQDDIERARADAALRATRNSNCNQINLPNGSIEDGYSIDLPFK
ncbi:MAG: hypothetical protein ACK5LE_01230 [Alphaproteobacteria bacterium]